VVESIAQEHGAPLSIMRPAITESALARPYPGWIKGFKMAEPIIHAFARGDLPESPAAPDKTLDVMPIDLVVNAILAACARDPVSSAAYYRVVSGARNPLRDQLGFAGARQAAMRAPSGLRRRMLQTLRAPYGVTGVAAGATEPVHARTLRQQQLVAVHGQADVLVAGIPYLGPYNVNSVMNPVLVYCTGLGYLFNMYRGGRPVVRAGGAMILFHPLTPEFDTARHPSYVDFFDEVLLETTEPAEIEARFEERYATDEWYRHLYRKGYAYHGVHPFYMWYWGAHARQHLGQVICVGADRPTAARWASGRRRRWTMRWRWPATRLAAARASRIFTRRRWSWRMCMAESGDSPLDDLRRLTRGWRWTRRPLAPAGAAAPRVDASAFDTGWARTPLPSVVRELALGGVLGRFCKAALSTFPSQGWSTSSTRVPRSSSSPTTPATLTGCSSCMRCRRAGARRPLSPRPRRTISSIPGRARLCRRWR
jgi:hypothetical protein